MIKNTTGNLFVNTTDNCLTNAWTNNWSYGNWATTISEYVDSPSEFVVEVTGFSKDELEIKFENNYLKIKGETKKIGNYTYSVNHSQYIYSTDRIKEINVTVENGLAYVKLVKENNNTPKISVK